MVAWRGRSMSSISEESVQSLFLSPFDVGGMKVKNKRTCEQWKTNLTTYIRTKTCTDRLYLVGT